MRLLGRVRSLLVMSLVLTAAACGDAPTGPAALDPDEVARVLPAITDARVRVTPGIVDAAVRERITEELEQIEMALIRGNARAAAFRTRVMRTVLEDYARATGATMRADAADVTAVALAVFEVAQLLRIEVDLSLIL